VRSRNETVFKWALYSAATALCFLIQGFLLQRLSLWGVIPFLYPMVAAVPASYEGSIPGTLYALALGIVCDLTLPGPLPCFYTLIFPVVGLCASLISQSLLPAGIICSLAISALAFLLTDGFHCLVLWMSGKAAWAAGSWVMIREFCVTAPFAIPVTLLFRSVFRRTHLDD